MAFRLALRPSLQAVRPQRGLLHQSALLRAASTADVGSSYIKGTVNDPTTFPEPSKSHGSYHWTFERIVSAATVPVVGATFLTSTNPTLDGILAVTMIIHSHLGFDQILTDYVHKRKFPTAAPIASWGVRLMTLGTLIGIYQFNTSDIGLTELIIRSWKA